jgi:hypothetical protein
MANQNELFQVTFYTKDNMTMSSLSANSTAAAATAAAAGAHRILSDLTGLTPSDDLMNMNMNTTSNSTSVDESSRVLFFSFKEILLFASVISATDTVAALTFVKEETEPKLFAILFGEGVINDAVCIVLYKILRDFTSSNEG